MNRRRSTGPLPCRTGGKGSGAPAGSQRPRNGGAGIAAGNGRASGGVYRGAAYESDIIAVKLGPARENSFPRTAELLQGVDYLVRQALRLGRPMAVNLSFGNNYGSHEPYN